MLPLLTVVVTTPPEPWWQVLIEILAPLIAVAIAIGGVLRGNHLRNKAAAAAVLRENARALTRAHRIRVSATGLTTTDEQTALLRITNTTDTPIYDLAISGATMIGAPIGAQWRATKPANGALDFLEGHANTLFVGTWWRPGSTGELEKGPLVSGSFTHVTPHLTWSNEDGVKFRMDGSGEIHIVE